MSQNIPVRPCRDTSVHFIFSVFYNLLISVPLFDMSFPSASEKLPLVREFVKNFGRTRWWYKKKHTVSQCPPFPVDCHLIQSGFKSIFTFLFLQFASSKFPFICHLSGCQRNETNESTSRVLIIRVHYSRQYKMRTATQKPWSIGDNFLRPLRLSKSW